MISCLEDIAVGETRSFKCGENSLLDRCYLKIGHLWKISSLFFTFPHFNPNESGHRDK